MRGFFVFLFLFLSLNAFAVEPQPGKEYFTVQVASFKEREKAQEVLDVIKDLPYARISYRSGRFKVRVGFFSSFSEARKFVDEKLKGRVKDYYITKIRFSPDNVYFAKGNTRSLPAPKPSVSVSFSEEENKVNVPLREYGNASISGVSGNCSREEERESYFQGNRTSGEKVQLGEVQSSESGEEKVAAGKPVDTESYFSANNSEEDVKLEKSETFDSDEERIEKKTTEGRIEKRSFYLKYELLAGLIFLLFLVFLFRFGLKKGAPPEDIENFVTKLLEEEKCEELVEVVLPLLSVQKENTFLRKALADCYLKQGKFLEAASLYEEIGEILDRKGLPVLADEFRRKAEKLYGSEFKGRG